MRKTVTEKRHQLVVEIPSVRLDQYLKDHFKDISRAYLQMMIESQKVTVNDQIGKKGTLLKKGDVVKIASFVHPSDRMVQPADLPSLEVVYESDNYLIIDKPAGLPTHPNDFEDRNCVANHFIGIYPDSIQVGEDPLRPGIVHRLDSDTSGLLILAKSQEAFSYFRQQFNERKIDKTYHALTLGELRFDEYDIQTPLAHHHQNPRKMVAVTSDKVAYRSTIREAQTLVFVKKRFQHTTYIEVKTKTGRMHQVRVHLASIGFPLVGDKLYQDQKQRNKDTFGLRRHFLHASTLKFEDPWRKETVTYQIELPEDLNDCLKIQEAK
ncbi:MAG: RluA family pseudouridine synthase [Bdellovibrionales bacterium]|nr:RluA family pseudouridine synthase [Bdellovibrionales bacterium]